MKRMAGLLDLSIDVSNTFPNKFVAEPCINSGGGTPHFMFSLKILLVFYSCVVLLSFSWT